MSPPGQIWQSLRPSVLRNIASTATIDASMPSPVGHAIAGVAAAFAVSAALKPRTLSIPIVLASAALAISPDFDLLAGPHRTYTHSIGAVAAVGIASCLVLARRPSDPLAPALALATAYASHLMLDWLSKDTAPPSGLAALWPFSWTYYQSPWTVFGEISRRYWLPNEFIVSNMLAALWEGVVLTPFLIVAWTTWSRRTLGK
jgi:membrane-bound metal-dependent hydrolase YbcI (DUF457 family)